jgi:vacuolar iron transporter family protein
MARTLEHEHTHQAIHQRLAAAPRPSYLRDWVYGGIDGAVTTFALVSGVAGAHLPPRVIVILGGATLIADGFAMAAANYLATRAEQEEFGYAASVERRHIEKFPAGEREEVREIVRKLGLTGELLERVVSAVTSDRERWIRMMLREEYGLPAEVRSPRRAAAATFSAFVVSGLAPLVPFAASVAGAFWLASAVTCTMFVLIGAVKSRWSIRHWWHSALETLVAGAGAATAAYAIGAWLRHITG